MSSNSFDIESHTSFFERAFKYFIETSFFERAFKYFIEIAFDVSDIILQTVDFPTLYVKLNDC